jgi:ATP-dependent DNA helicase RecG
VDVPEISRAALREAVINAISHRDWRDPDYIQIAIYKNRVEIRNPGGLFDGLTFEAMRRGNVSHRRNPLIADLFRRIDMVEAWGRGMPLILENAPTVEFREIARLFIASFERPSAAIKTTKETTRETNKPTKETTKETAKEKTGERPVRMKEKLLLLIRQQPEITAAALSAATGIGVDGVNYHLNQLKQTGKLRRVGSTKGGHWEVPEPDPKGKT